MSYEAHITISTDDAEIGKTVAAEFGWKHSEIARDPLLGDATYFYLTGHSAVYEDIAEDMQDVYRRLRQNGVFVFREKIEHIVLDVRHGTLPVKTLAQRDEPVAVPRSELEKLAGLTEFNTSALAAHVSAWAGRQLGPLRAELADPHAGRENK